MTESRPTPEAFSSVIADQDPAMVIVTTATEDERAGCLVGFHSQAGIHPARYAVWLSKANHTYRVAAAGTALAVHFVGVSQRQLAVHFGAQSGDEVNKFADLRWRRGPDGVPVLLECFNYFAGPRLTMVDDGSDHVCFVLAPTEAHRRDLGERFLRLSDVSEVDPGHQVEERPHPPTQRAANPDPARRGPADRTP